MRRAPFLAREVVEHAIACLNAGVRWNSEVAAEMNYQMRKRGESRSAFEFELWRSANGYSVAACEAYSQGD